MIDKAQIGVWVAILSPILGALGVIWRKIRHLEVKTDGMLEWRSRADRAEGEMAGRDFEHDREKDEAKERAGPKEKDER
jgi:hypothetical protein